ncbi:hypothetical protein FACS1894116_04950 [Betaproteobacteria bacterium]|nr:hypothetical protein FACS1894116_04950 [Betaproteobacteria bacterium]GHT97527.1 hypothetical protein FACS1894154_01100 [Betaproteobacteria bacterium]GHU22018.1 hypothetical protein FACS189488_01730 [Betaproteobacteria bacterium]
MKNKPMIVTTGEAVKRERREGDEIRLTTFIPIKIRKRDGRAVVVWPAVAEVAARNKIAVQRQETALGGETARKRQFPGIQAGRYPKAQAPAPRGDSGQEKGLGDYSSPYGWW